jgi:hypothetical protein
MVWVLLAFAVFAAFVVLEVTGKLRGPGVPIGVLVALLLGEGIRERTAARSPQGEPESTKLESNTSTEPAPALVVPQTWGFPRAERRIGWVLVGMGPLASSIGLLAVFSAPSRYWWAAAPVAITGGLIAAYGYLGWIVPSVEATERGIAIRNPIGHREIPWSDVVDVSTSIWGLRISLADGSTSVAWAVQKSNWSIWNNRRTRADHVAETLTKESRRRRAAVP